MLPVGSLEVMLKLEIVLNSKFLLDKQVATVARKAFRQIHLVCQLCPFLGQEALRTVVHGLVISIAIYLIWGCP